MIAREWYGEAGCANDWRRPEPVSGRTVADLTELVGPPAKHISIVLDPDTGIVPPGSEAT
jgi:hypothetical protein